MCRLASIAPRCRVLVAAAAAALIASKLRQRGVGIGRGRHQPLEGIDQLVHATAVGAPNFQHGTRLLARLQRAFVQVEGGGVRLDQIQRLVDEPCVENVPAQRQEAAPRSSRVVRDIDLFPLALLAQGLDVTPRGGQLAVVRDNSPVQSRGQLQGQLIQCGAACARQQRPHQVDLCCVHVSVCLYEC